jgi:HK97 family phage major capsid protein
MENKKSIYGSDEYRSAFSKFMAGEPLNIVETKAFGALDITKRNDGFTLPAEVEGKLVEYVSSYNKFYPLLKNVWSVDIGGEFGYPVATIDTGANVLKTIPLQVNSQPVYVELSEFLVKNHSERFEKIVMNLLHSRAAQKLEEYIVTADGTLDYIHGLPVAGSGEAGAYVENTDLVITASLTEDNLISLIKMVEGHPEAKFVMNEAMFLDNVLPLMATSKLISQGTDGTYRIGTYDVIISAQAADDAIYFADFGFFAGNITYKFGRHQVFDKGLINFHLWVEACLSPVSGLGAFAKLEISGS